MYMSTVHVYALTVSTRNIIYAMYIYDINKKLLCIFHAGTIPCIY